MIDALSAPPSNSSPSNSSNSKSLLFSSREHQDAQELFQLLSSLLKDEATAVDRDAGRKYVGLSAVWPDDDDGDGGERGEEGSGRVVNGLGGEKGRGRGREEPVGKGVFEGLTANRRSCVVCGYTEAVMHFGFDNLQLSLPLAVSPTSHI